MDDKPHDARSSVGVPIENFEGPVQKLATWRTAAAMWAFVMVFPALFVGGSYHHDHNSFMFERHPKNTGKYDVPFAAIVVTHPLMSGLFRLAFVETLAEKSRKEKGAQAKAETLARVQVRENEKRVFMLKLYFVVPLAWFGEWVFYGWLMDTWSYRYRLARSVTSKLQQ